MRGSLWTAVVAGLATVPVVMAHAQEEVAVASILPAGDIVADGATQVTLHVVAASEDGPLEGLSLGATASAGSIDEVVELGSGLYAIRWTPPKVNGPTPLRVTVKGKGPAGAGIHSSREWTVYPTATTSAAITSNPDALVLGSGDTATLSLSLPSVRGVAPRPEDVLVRVSAGELGEFVPLGGGRFTARYTPQEVNYPHLVMVTLFDRRDPEGTAASAVIKVQGKVSYPVAAQVGDNVVLRVAGREFGPVRADANGKAMVPIIVPPGVGTATRILIRDGEVLESELDLRTPEVRALQLFPVLPSVPSDARVRLPVRLLVLDALGEPNPDARPDLVVTAGQISRPIHLGGGLFAADYTPPDGRAASQATIQATAPGGVVQADSVEVNLLPAMPVAGRLTAEPQVLPPDATTVSVFARVLAADGTGLPGRQLGVDFVGGKPTGAVVDSGGGDYRFDLRPLGPEPIRGSAAVLSQGSTNPVRYVVVLPGSDRIPADGTSSETLTVVATDRFGYPVPDVEVRLSVVSGGGTVPATVRTDANGRAIARYRAGQQVGLAEIRATAAGYEGGVGMLQGIEEGPLLPPSGSATFMSVSDALRATQSTLTIRRGQAVAPVATPPTVDGPATAITRLTLSAEPSVVAPRGRVQIRIRALDASGATLPGEGIELRASDGADTGELVAQGDGSYLATLTVPEEATGPIEVSAITADGTVTEVYQLRVIGEAPPDVDPWATDVATTEPVVAAAPPEPEPERPVVDKPVREIERPWFRLKLAGLVSSYGYEQAPTDQPGPLLTNVLSWGGDEGGAAVPVGGEVRLRMIAPAVPYLGLDATFRASRYSVSAPQFSAPAPDTLFSVRADIVGRVPVAIRASELSLGLRAGFRWDDFITFKGCSSPGCTVSYEPLGVPGLGLAAEVGLDVGRTFMLASGGLGLAYATDLYAGSVDFDLGYDITRNFFVVAGFGWQQRNTELVGGDTGVLLGTLSDQQFLGTFGVGLAL